MKTAQGRDLSCVRARVQDCITFSIITVRIWGQRMAKMRLERQSQALGVFMSAQRSLDSEKQKPQQGISPVPPASHRLWEGRPVDGGWGEAAGTQDKACPPQWCHFRAPQTSPGFQHTAWAPGPPCKPAPAGHNS